jgi:hypothetical protein
VINYFSNLNVVSYALALNHRRNTRYRCRDDPVTLRFQSALVRQAGVSAGWLYFYEVKIPGGGRDAGDYHSSLYELQASELYV